MYAEADIRTGCSISCLIVQSQRTERLCEPMAISENIPA